MKWNLEEAIFETETLTTEWEGMQSVKRKKITIGCATASEWIPGECNVNFKPWNVLNLDC